MGTPIAVINRQVYPLNHNCLRYALSAMEAPQQNQLSDSHLLGMLETISDALVVVDHHWHYLYINSQGARVVGRDAAQLIGKTVWTEFSARIGTTAYIELQQAMEMRTARHFEIYDAAPDRWFEYEAYPWENGAPYYLPGYHESKAS
jgi:PAS domain S-box-containing protein